MLQDAQMKAGSPDLCILPQARRNVTMDSCGLMFMYSVLVEGSNPPEQAIHIAGKTFSFPKRIAYLLELVYVNVVR